MQELSLELRLPVLNDAYLSALPWAHQRTYNSISKLQCFSLGKRPSDDCNTAAGVRQMEWDCLDAAITEDSRDWRLLSQRVGVLTQPIRQTPIPRREARRSVAPSRQPESQPGELVTK